jgi:hypothetical protein
MATAAVLALTLAHFHSPPAEALPLAAGVAGAKSEAVFVRWRWWSRQRTRQSGIAVFIVPGLYWGPAWWDPNYTQLCWKKIRPCPNCLENWIYVC